MGSRLKEGEKSEKLIRGLLKQPANSKCINCSSRGPQYVCTTFWTFVCTNCSGIHREFTHRVKSISMAKFTPEEISYLQAGGNERAKEIYFKEVDLHRVPDSRNVDGLRDFIKHVYVDKRYTGEKRTERPSIAKMGNKEEPFDNRRKESYQSDLPSRGYDGRSPGFDQGSQRNSDSGRSRAPIAVINDWSRKDRFANGKRSEDDRSSEGDPKVVAKSVDSNKDLNGSSSPEVGPITDILGENSVCLQVIEPPRTKMPDGSPQVTQQTASSNSSVSSNGKPSEIKQEASLIDFEAEFQPPVTAAVSQPHQSSDLTTVANTDNWSFLDSTLTHLHLSVPAPASGFPTSAASSSTIASTPAAAGDSLFTNVVPVSLTPFTGAVTAAPPASNPNGAYAGAAVGDFLSSSGGAPPAVHSSTSPNGTAWPWLSMQPQQQSVFTGSGGVSSSQTSSQVAAQPVEVQPSGRKQLPADLFTAMYAPQPVHAPLWHAGLAPGTSFPAVQMPTFPQSTKSANPFDLGSESSPAQALEFPPMTSLQNALPNLATPSWMPSQASPYPSGAPQLAPSFGASAILPDPYKTQQLSVNLHPRPQGINGFANDITGFSSTNPAVDLGARISAPAPSNPFG